MPKAHLADRVFLTADGENTPQHVAVLATFLIPHDAPADFVARLAERFRDQKQFASPFNYVLRSVALRAVAPSWKLVDDDAIDLDYHFRHAALPAPGGERELGVLVSHLHSIPLDPTRPLWECHLIEGLDRNRFAFYLKIHHAVIDGVGGVTRFQQMISSNGQIHDFRALWTIGPTRREPDPAKARMWTRVQDAASSGRERLDVVRSLTTTAARMVSGARSNAVRDEAVPFVAPKSVLNGRIGRQRRVATQSFDFERVRRIAASGGVRINDVFLAASAGGLRRYLLEIGELPEASLTAGTPVNIRGAEDDSTTNAFSMIVVKLGTQIEDPLERLAAIARSSDAGKVNLRSLSKRVRELYPALFMAPFVGQNLLGIGGRVAPPYNVSISNVPGPLESQYLSGARLESLYPIGVLYHGVGLFIALVTASGRMSVGFVGDRDALPHVQRLAVYTGEALAELETVLGVDRSSD